MLEIIQEKFGLSYPMAVVESVSPQIPKTGLLLLSPNATIVDALQMEAQSLRMIGSMIRK